MATDRRSPDRLDSGRNSRNGHCPAVLRFLLTPRSVGTPCGILPCCSIFCPVEQPNRERANTWKACDASPSGQCQWRTDLRVKVFHQIPRAQCAILPQWAYATDQPYASDCDVPTDWRCFRTGGTYYLPSPVQSQN